MIIKEGSLCGLCKHLLNDVCRPRCKAFPNGIPNDILSGEISHLKPVDGDKGIIYEETKFDEHND